MNKLPITAVFIMVVGTIILKYFNLGYVTNNILALIITISCGLSVFGIILDMVNEWKDKSPLKGKSKGVE